MPAQTAMAILSGNELIVQGAKEAGFHLYTGYPGSPLADFFNILYAERAQLEERGIRVVIGNSEANAAAMASGAKQAGKNTILAMKSMGLHVAADALSVGQFADPGPKWKDDNGSALSPGVVVVVGDDPWSMSTSTAADSRYLYKHLHMPFLEPSNPQELKDWIKVALELSQQSSLYVGVLLTTFMAEGGGRVELFSEKAVDGSKYLIDPATFDLSRNVMVPPNSLIADNRMIAERFPRLQQVLAQKNLDRTWGNAQAPIGIVAAGLCYEMVKEVLEQADLQDHVGLYKPAGSYPLNVAQLLPWLNNKKELIVVEEKRAFLEQELSSLILREHLAIQLHGKEFYLKNNQRVKGFSAAGGLDNDLVSQGLNIILQDLLPQLKQARLHCPDYQEYPDKLLRLPTFCPGCPHRDTLSVMKELRQVLAKKSIPLLAHGDVGCYSLSFLAPFKEMHNLSAMGQGGALGAGVDLFAKNPSVVLMGDSTFFHSGLTDISNSVQMGHNITYILLDNDNTAMTGHQMTPVSGESVEGYKRPRQSIAQVVRALGVNAVIEINPVDRYFYLNLMQEYINKSGVKVIVSNKECGLTYQARVRQEERQQLAHTALESKTFFQINSQSCEDCRVCIDMTGCPGLSQTLDAYGTKTIIDPQICVSDGHCTRLKVCPSFEKVVVHDYRPTLPTMARQEWMAQLPLPTMRWSLASLMQNQIPWRAVVVGVGGSGVTTISRVIAAAATEMEGRNDCDFKFMEQKGLAQRNGRVTGHLALHAKNKSCANVTPKGSAQLLIASDLFDAPSALAYLAADGEAVCERVYQVPLTLMLAKAGIEEMPASQIIQTLQNKIGERGSFLNAKEIVQGLLGKTIYAPTMLLGAAFQRGLLPFSLAAMEAAIASAIKHKHEVEQNLSAFHVGRWWVAFGESHLRQQFQLPEKNATPLATWRQSLQAAYLPWQGRNRMLQQFDQALEKLQKNCSWLETAYAAQYLHDCLVYKGNTDLIALVDEIISATQQLPDEKNKKMWARIFVKTHFVKDEVFVAHQMISPIKVVQDQQLYQAMGKKYSIERMNRPSFQLFGFKLEMDISPSDWMLKIMRHMRWLRLVMPSWHQRERAMATAMQTQLRQLLQQPDQTLVGKKLQALDAIKGYREVRYQKWQELMEQA